MITARCREIQTDKLTISCLHGMVRFVISNREMPDCAILLSPDGAIEVAKRILAGISGSEAPPEVEGTLDP